MRLHILQGSGIKLNVESDGDEAGQKNRITLSRLLLMEPLKHVTRSWRG